MIEPLLTSANFTNASNSLAGGASSFGLLGTTFVVVIIAVIGVFVGSSVSRIEWYTRNYRRSHRVCTTLLLALRRRWLLALL